MNAGHHRTKRVLWGTLSLAVSTVIVNALWLVIIGMAARYFLPEQFGLWSILISLVGLFMTGGDLGLSNALKNQLSQLYGRTDSSQSTDQTYFFSVFYILIISATILTVVFFIIQPFIPWAAVLKTTDASLTNQGAVLFTLGASLCAFNTAFNLFLPGFFSYQQCHWNAIVAVISKLILLLFMWGFVFSGSSFFSTTAMFFIVTLASSIVSMAIFLLVRRWKPIVISISTLIAKLRELWRKSAQFAFLQIFSTFLLYADLFVIGKLLGLGSVGDYFLVKRIYLLVSAFQFTALLPIWSAYTEAVESKDYEWTCRVLSKSALYTSSISLVCVLFFALAGNYALNIWKGSEINAFSLFVFIGLWNIVYNWNNCFSVFLNATGNLKVQTILVGISAVIFIPLALLLGGKFGIIGICVALLLVNLPLSLSNPIQSFNIIKKFKAQT